VKKPKTLRWYDIYWRKTVGFSRVLATSEKEAESIAENHCDENGIFDAGGGRLVETIWHNPTDEQAYIGDVLQNETE